MITLGLIKCLIVVVDAMSPIYAWAIPQGVQQALTVLISYIGHGFQFVGLFIDLNFVWMVFDCMVVYFGIYIVRAIVTAAIGLFTGAEGE